MVGFHAILKIQSTTFLKLHPRMLVSLLRDFNPPFRQLPIQRSAKVFVRGLVKFVPALAKLPGTNFTTYQYFSQSLYSPNYHVLKNWIETYQPWQDATNARVSARSTSYQMFLQHRVVFQTMCELNLVTLYFRCNDGKSN